jgi:hypothetical protein
LFLHGNEVLDEMPAREIWVITSSDSRFLDARLPNLFKLAINNHLNRAGL